MTDTGIFAVFYYSTNFTKLYEKKTYEKKATHICVII